MTYPIVLAHGVCRFDRLWSDALDIDNSADPDRDRWHYFKGLRTMLADRGFDVFHSAVSWSAGVDTRACELKRNVLRILEKSRAPKVNLIAHSMGGLDARHMLYNFRASDPLSDRVASLTTISTPHEGSPFADWGIANLPLLVPVAKKMGLHIDGIQDLTTKRCQQFNHHPDVVRFEKSIETTIRFQTFAGVQTFSKVSEALKFSHTIIKKKAGDNDGLVSVASARWRDRYFKGILENTDHLNELGWQDPIPLPGKEDRRHLLERIHRFYLAVARDLP